jgi:hypothetical protein
VKAKKDSLNEMLTPDYIVGLVDGEGSFTVYVRDPSRAKTAIRRVVVEPKFYVKLIEKDKDILFALRDFFGCGSVYYQKDTRPNHQNCYRFEVYRWDDLSKIIIPFFKKHTLRFVSKRNDFSVFCQMMKLLQKKVHLTETGVKQLLKLKQQMH